MLIMEEENQICQILNLEVSLQMWELERETLGKL